MASPPPTCGIDPQLYRLHDAFKFIQIMTLSILTWEILVTLPKEVSLYRRRGVKRTLLLLSFSRYFTLICMIADVVFNFLNGATVEFCTRVRWVLPMWSSAVQFASIPLLLLRTYAIWNKNRVIAAILVVLWIIPLIIGIYVCTTYTGIPYAFIIGLETVGGCGNDPKNAWGTVPFVLNLAVDSSIFILTLGRLLFQPLSPVVGRRSIRTLLIRDGTVYYLVVVAINVVNIVFFLAPGLPSLARPLIAVPATIAPAILVGRLYFNLANNFMPPDTSHLSTTNHKKWSLGTRNHLTYTYGGTPRQIDVMADSSIMDGEREVYQLDSMNIKYTVDVVQEPSDPAPSDNLRTLTSKVDPNIP